MEEDADLILGLPSDVRITPDGDPIFEGDIVFPREIIPKISLENGSTPSIHDADTIVTNGLTGRTAIGEPVLYWPDGRIVYTFHSSITPDEKAVILSAIRHWEQETCLTFREREPLDVYYLRFRSDAPGCWSLVGRQFLRIGVGQDISIGKGCAQVSSPGSCILDVFLDRILRARDVCEMCERKGVSHLSLFLLLMSERMIVRRRRWSERRVSTRSRW